MPTDRMLVTLLRALHTHSDQQDTPRILSTAASLLTTLSNPLNLTLVTSQLLSSPAIWARPDGLCLCLHFMGVYQSASLKILRAEEQRKEEIVQGKRPHQDLGRPILGGNLSRDVWVKAVINGADDRSPRWRHVLVIAGLLIGFAAQGREGLSKSLRSTIEAALVRATNLALEDVGVADEMAAHCISLVLNYSFELLSDYERSRLNYDRLLPVLIGSTFFSNEGYRSAYFLAPIDIDVVQVGQSQFSWPEQSSSYQQISALSTRPLVATMGPLSRLIAHTIENVSQPWLVQTALEDLAGFARQLNVQWGRNRLSEVDVSEEQIFFDQQTLARTLTTLWKVLRSVLFSVVIMLRSVIGRALNDAALATDNAAPILATNTLSAISHLSFISTRLGANSLTQHTFVHLTALDILTAYPSATKSYLSSLTSTLPPSPALSPQHPLIPSHPHARTHTLHYLHTAEHLVPHLPHHLLETLLAHAAPYLTITLQYPSLRPLFETAHALTLSMLASSTIPPTPQQIEQYTNALLMVFPSAISPRQFRLAVRILVRIVSSPALLSRTGTAVVGVEVLLELFRMRAEEALTAPASAQVRMRDSDAEDAEETSPAGALVLALCDCLPVMPARLLEEWLGIVWGLCLRLRNREGEYEKCKAVFWDSVSGGSMDVERAAVCVRWWSDGGFVAHEREKEREREKLGGDEAMISGALGGSKL